MTSPSRHPPSPGPLLHAGNPEQEQSAGCPLQPGGCPGPERVTVAWWKSPAGRAGAGWTPERGRGAAALPACHLAAPAPASRQRVTRSPASSRRAAAGRHARASGCFSPRPVLLGPLLPAIPWGWGARRKQRGWGMQVEATQAPEQTNSRTRNLG